MNWTQHPTLYQLTHWWHWLTYGQNATVVALIGLILYTHYTRRMMVAAEETRRLSLTPYLLAEDLRKNYPPQFAITNVAGPAVRCEIWYQPVGKDFKLGLRLKRGENISINQWVPSILSGSDPLLIPMFDNLIKTPVLTVIECFDTGGGLHQLQLLQRYDGNGGMSIENLFVVQDTFLPAYQRYGHRLWQLWRLYRMSIIARTKGTNADRLD
jgi:hypothetical protein